MIFTLFKLNQKECNGGCLQSPSYQTDLGADSYII